MTKLALYYSPGACSLAAHAALREWGAPFDARPVLVAKGEHVQPEYLALNPRGRVPTLVIDGEPIRELSGILTWIGQQSGLFPEAGTIEAARCGEWLGWLTSTVHIGFAQIWRGHRFATDAAHHEAIRQRGYDTVGECFREIDTALKHTPYVLGDALSVADLNLIFFYRWGGRIGLDMPGHYPAWRDHTERVAARPAVRTTLDIEGIGLGDTLPAPDGVVLPAR